MSLGPVIVAAVERFLDGRNDWREPLKPIGANGLASAETGIWITLAPGQRIGLKFIFDEAQRRPGLAPRTSMRDLLGGLSGAEQKTLRGPAQSYLRHYNAELREREGSVVEVPAAYPPADEENRGLWRDELELATALCAARAFLFAADEYRQDGLGHKAEESERISDRWLLECLQWAKAHGIKSPESVEAIRDWDDRSPLLALRSLARTAGPWNDPASAEKALRVTLQDEVRKAFERKRNDPLGNQTDHIDLADLPAGSFSDLPENCSQAAAADAVVRQRHRTWREIAGADSRPRPASRSTRFRLRRAGKSIEEWEGERLGREEKVNLLLNLIRREKPDLPEESARRKVRRWLSNPKRYITQLTEVLHKRDDSGDDPEHDY